MSLLEEPLSIHHLACLDEDHRIVGFLVGKQHDMAEWRFKKEMREFEDFCRKLQGLKPAKRTIERSEPRYDASHPQNQRLFQRILETDRKLRAREHPTESPPRKRGGIETWRYHPEKVTPYNQCEACCGDRQCKRLGKLSRGGRRVCSAHRRANVVYFVESEFLLEVA